MSARRPFVFGVVFCSDLSCFQPEDGQFLAALPLLERRVEELCGSRTLSPPRGPLLFPLYGSEPLSLSSLYLYPPPHFFRALVPRHVVLL